jgi:tRNA(fMet)-specific endonuclease VapC
MQLSLDNTNICIYPMKHQPPQVAERFSACRVGEVLSSAITAAELEYGVVRCFPPGPEDRELGGVIPWRSVCSVPWHKSQWGL